MLHNVTQCYTTCCTSCYITCYTTCYITCYTTCWTHRPGTTSAAESEFSKDLLMTGLASVDAIVTSFLEAKTDQVGQLPARSFSEGGMQRSQDRLSQLSLATSSQKSTQTVGRGGGGRDEMPEVHHQQQQQVHRARLPQLVTAGAGNASKTTSSSQSSLAFLPDKVHSCPSASGSQYLAKSSNSEYLGNGSKSEEYLANGPKSGEYLGNGSKSGEYLGNVSKSGEYLRNGSTSIGDGESSSSPSSPFLSAPSSRLFHIKFNHSL